MSTTATTSARARLLAFQRAAAEHGVQVSVHSLDPAGAQRLRRMVLACAAALAVPIASMSVHEARAAQAFDAAGPETAIVASASPQAGAAWSGVAAGIRAVVRTQELSRTPEARAIAAHLVTSACDFSLTSSHAVVQRCVNPADQFPLEQFRAAAAKGEVAVLGQFRGIWVLLADVDGDGVGAQSIRFFDKNGASQDAMVMSKPLVQRLMQQPEPVRDAALAFIMGHERGHLIAGDEPIQGPATPEALQAEAEQESAADFNGFQEMSLLGVDVATQRAAVQAVFEAAPDSAHPQVTSSRQAKLSEWFSRETDSLEQVARNAEREGRVRMAAH
jgi:hypothetical protein